MKKELSILVLFTLLSFSIYGHSEVDAFLKLGGGLSFFHTQGNFTEGTPKVDFRFIPYYTYGPGITFSGIGVGITFLNFNSPYTKAATKTLYSIILGGTTISYYQNKKEKLFDLSFTGKRERLLTRGKLFLDIAVDSGFRYWKFDVTQPSLYQIYFGVSFNPSFALVSVGKSQDWAVK